MDCRLMSLEWRPLHPKLLVTKLIYLCQTTLIVEELNLDCTTCSENALTGKIIFLISTNLRIQTLLCHTYLIYNKPSHTYSQTETPSLVFLKLQKSRIRSQNEYMWKLLLTTDKQLKNLILFFYYNCDIFFCFSALRLSCEKNPLVQQYLSWGKGFVNVKQQVKMKIRT